jgi:hypothetical protein
MMKESDIPRTIECFRLKGICQLNPEWYQKNKATTCISPWPHYNWNDPNKVDHI